MTISLPIQGNGFVLREFHQSDAKNLADIEFDPDVKRFLAVPAKAKDKWTEELRSLGIRGWVIQVDGQTAGCASLGRAKRKGDGERIRSRTGSIQSEIERRAGFDAFAAEFGFEIRRKWRFDRNERNF